MKHLAVLLALVFLFPAVGEAKKKKKKPGKAVAEKYTASKDTVKLVRYVTTTDTADLNPEVIPPFMEVDAATLPGSLRPKYRAKVAELEALRTIAEGKKKPPIRRAGKEENHDCDIEEGTLAYVNMLKETGFEPIATDEENFLLSRTKCTQCELMSEFTLKIVVVPAKKKGERPTAYRFLSVSDPLMALVAQYRSKHVGTNFFGAFFGACR